MPCSSSAACATVAPCWRRRRGEQPVTSVIHARRIELLRHPELGWLRILVVGRKQEPSRHDADDLVGPAVDLNGPSDDRRIGAISAAPQRVAEHDDVRPFGEVLGGRENPSDGRTHSEDRKRVRRDAGGCDTLRVTAAGQVDLPLAPGRHFPQSSGAAPVVHDLPRRNPGFVECRPLAPDHHRASWIGPRQRAEQHGIDHAEDRGVRADSQGQRDYRHRGEAGMTREQSGAKTQILV